MIPWPVFFLGSHGDGFAKGAMWSVVTALMWSSWGLLSTFPVVSLSHCVSGARSVLLDVVLSWPWLYVWLMFVIRGWYTTNRDASADEVYVWRVLSWAWIIFGEACRHVWLLRNRITLSPQQLGGIGFNQRAQHSQHWATSQLSLGVVGPGYRHFPHSKLWKRCWIHTVADSEKGSTKVTELMSSAEAGINFIIKMLCSTVTTVLG